MRLALFAVIFVAGCAVGGILDGPIRRFFVPVTAHTDAYFDRIELLERVRPKGDVAFVGNSHVERGFWKQLLQLDVANYGVGGDDTVGLLSRVHAIKAETYILAIGINDIIQGRAPDVIAANIGTIIAALDGEVVLLTVMPVRGSYARFNEDILLLNRMLADVCTGRCLLVDTHSALTDADGSLDWRLTRDGLHLNAMGYEALATIIRAGARSTFQQTGITSVQRG